MVGLYDLGVIAQHAVELGLVAPDHADCCYQRARRSKMEGERIPDVPAFLSSLGLNAEESASVQQHSAVFAPIEPPTKEQIRNRETFWILGIVVFCGLGLLVYKICGATDGLGLWGAILAALLALEVALRRRRPWAVTKRWVTTRWPRLRRLGYLSLRRALVLAGLLSGVALATTLTLNPSIALEVRVCAYVVVAVAAYTAVLSELKHRALMFAEARSGAMKDMHSCLHEISRDPTLSANEKRTQTVVTTLSTLVSIVRLNEWSWLKRLLSLRCKRSTNATFLVPDPKAGEFRIETLHHPVGIPQGVKKAYELMQQHHRPKYYVPKKYYHLIHLARGVDPEGFEDRYLNFPEEQRARAISLCGYLWHKKDKQRSIKSEVASRCRALDRTWKTKLKDAHVTQREIDFLSVESFLAYPVGNHGIMMVARNVTKGFCNTDHQFAEEIAGLLGQALDTLALAQQIGIDA